MSDMREKLADICDEEIQSDNPSCYTLADAIIAALPDMVKPLEFYASPDGGTKYANSIMGRYAIWDEYYRPPHQVGGTKSDNPEAAAQAHHTAAILSSLGLTK